MSIHLLGIDVGTGGTRAIVIDSSGVVIASAESEHVAFESLQPGWAEQDPQDWWRAAIVAIPEALRKAHLHGSDIGCIGLVGQMHGAVLLDADDQVLRPALIWCDQRTQEQCEWIERTVGVERLVKYTANPALTNFTLTKLLWVREHEQALWARFVRVLLPKDYVRFRLTGEHATDMADASGTLMLDVVRRRWSSELLTEIGIPDSCLPRVFESPEVCARVSASGADATGLRVGTPVVAGAGDQAAGAVGMGVVRPGEVSATIGTSGVVFASTNTPTFDAKGRLHTFCHAVPQRWHVMGVTQAAGLSLQWFREQLARDLDKANAYDILIAEAAQTPPGAEGLLWAPYLMGERTPHLDPTARACLTGLVASHTRGHVVRAILEGVAFSLKDTFSLLEELRIPVNRIRVGGGGARSPLWRQIQADIFGQPVETVATEEGAAYGAALLAGVGASVWRSVDEACAAVVSVKETIEPDRATSIRMGKQYEAYRALYPALKDVNAKLV